MKDEIVSLEQTLAIDIAPDLPDPLADADIITIWLETKKNPRTQREYYKDIKDFFQVIANKPPTPDLVLQFLHLSQSRATAIVLQYKTKLLKSGLTENTVNRRVATIKSLVSLGRKLGICSYTLEEVKPEKVTPYRDTSGIKKQDAKRVLELCDLTTDKGLRDYALLRLLWDNALRRNEVSQLNIEDFDLPLRRLTILGKGRGNQKEIISLSNSCSQAISNWLNVREIEELNEPLFTNFSRSHNTRRLTGDGIYKIVRKYCKTAGIPNLMSPHRWRHGAITTVLELSDGDIKKGLKFSRHKDPKVLMTYDDNRNQYQEEMTDLLSELVD